MGSLYGGRFNRGSANDPALDDNRFLKCILQVIWRISKECFEHHITRAIRQILRNLTQILIKLRSGLRIARNVRRNNTFMSLNFFKPTFVKILITLFLAVLLFFIGIVYLNDPIWVKTGCAPNPSCPYCEICMAFSWYNIFRYESLFLLVPLYLFSCIIVGVLKKFKSKS